MSLENEQLKTLRRESTEFISGCFDGKSLNVSKKSILGYVNLILKEAYDLGIINSDKEDKE